jgi:hypothetical protein
MEGKKPPKQLFWVRPDLPLNRRAKNAIIAYIEEVRAGHSVKDCVYQLPQESNSGEEQINAALEDLKSLDGVESDGYEAAFEHQQQAIAEGRVLPVPELE